MDSAEPKLGEEVAMAGSRRRREWFIGFLGTIALIVILAIGGSLRGPRVPAVTVERKPLVQRVVATGRVLVQNRIRLGTMAAGIVSCVNVDKGDRVKAGDLLVELRDDEARAAVDQARARLAQVRDVEARTADEDLVQAETALAQAERQFRRADALIKDGGISTEEFDSARESRDSARSRRDSAVARARSKRNGGSDERSAAAALSQAEARLAYTKITASADGMVLSRDVEPGDVVQAGQALIVVAKDGPTYLSLQPEEKNLAYLSVGQEAIASADAFADRTFSARIDLIAPAVDPARGTVEVRLIVPDPPDYLRPDMTVSVDVATGRSENALVVPTDAVRDADGSRPWLYLARNGRAERREIVLGIRGQGVVEVRDGVAEGDRVILATPRVRNGQRVRAFPQRSAS
jgi:HlyD family secretion protein